MLLYSLANDKPINSSKYSINSEDNGICINFKDVEPQDIKLKPAVDIIGISNPDLSENFFTHMNLFPKLFNFKIKQLPQLLKYLRM